MTNKFIIFMLIFFQSILFSQEAINSQYSHIKQLIISKQLNKAREEIKLAMAGNENDPTLNLYQTELWIAEGEFYYNSGQYKLALEIYEKAIQQYPSNPMVKMKYQEMVNKVKAKSNNIEPKESKPIESLPVQPLGLQGGLTTQTIESMKNSGNTESNTNINFAMSRTDFLLTIVCIQNFILLLFLFLRLPKKQ